MRSRVVLYRVILKHVSDGQNMISMRSWDTSTFHGLKGGNAALYPSVCLTILDVSVTLFDAIVSAIVSGYTCQYGPEKKKRVE